MNITNTHLKIVKVIELCKDVTPEELADEFSVDISTIKLYLKVVGRYLDGDNKKLSSQELIEKIRDKKNILRELRKDSSFEKAERKNTLFYYLLTFPFVNLSSLAETLNVTKRTLNYDLEEIREELSKVFVEIGQSRKGVYLKCSNSRKVKIMSGILYKITIEKDYLSRKTRGTYAELMRRSGIRSHYSFRKTCREICEIMNPHYSKYYALTLPMAYYNLSRLEKVDLIKDIPKDKILKYWYNIVSREKFLKIQDIIRESAFGELPRAYMYYLMTIVCYCTNYPKFISPITLKSLEKVKAIIGEYLGDEYTAGEDFFTEGRKWVEYCYFRNQYNIFDLNLAVMNLNINKDEKIEEAVKKIREFVPLFSRGDFFKLMGTFIKKEGIEKKIKILVHTSALNSIKFLVKEKLERNYSIEILDLVHQRDIENYLKENKVDDIITIENIRLRGRDVLNYKL